MLKNKFPPQLELISDYEINMGIRELSEGKCEKLQQTPISFLQFLSWEDTRLVWIYHGFYPGFKVKGCIPHLRTLSSACVGFLRFTSECYTCQTLGCHSGSRDPYPLTLHLSGWLTLNTHVRNQ